MGNALVRRVLGGGQLALSTSAGRRARPQGATDRQPARVIAIADKAQQRLCRRFRGMVAANKPKPKVAVAVARELAGFLWAALQPPTVA